MTKPETITIPRPKPAEFIIAVTDADGASAWVTGQKAHAEALLADGVLAVLEDGQRVVHEQREPVA